MICTPSEHSTKTACDVSLVTNTLYPLLMVNQQIKFFPLAETESHEGKRKQESLWPIFKIHHQKSRYIYDLFYRRKAISRELYNFCLDEKIADKNLIAKWKKPGYENLCCLRCIQTRDTNFGTNCICRVPKGKLEEVSIVVIFKHSQ